MSNFQATVYVRPSGLADHLCVGFGPERRTDVQPFDRAYERALHRRGGGSAAAHTTRAESAGSGVKLETDKFMNSAHRPLTLPHFEGLRKKSDVSEICYGFAEHFVNISSSTKKTQTTSGRGIHGQERGEGVEGSFTNSGFVLLSLASSA